jgi:hypothetical protein
MKTRDPENEIKPAGPMLRANSSSVLRSNLRRAGLPKSRSSFSRRQIAQSAGCNKRGACKHRLAVLVRTIASKQGESI